MDLCGSKRLMTTASRMANCASIVHQLAALSLVASWTETANSSKLRVLEVDVHVGSAARRAILQTRQAVNLRNSMPLQSVRQHPKIVTQSVRQDLHMFVGCVCVRLLHLQTHAQSGVHVLRSSAADPTHDQERCTGEDDLGQCLSVRWNCLALDPHYARPGPVS